MAESEGIEPPLPKADRRLAIWSVTTPATLRINGNIVLDLNQQPAITSVISTVRPRLCLRFQEVSSRYLHFHPMLPYDNGCLARLELATFGTTIHCATSCATDTVIGTPDPVLLCGVVSFCPTRCLLPTGTCSRRLASCP